jgi:hypothetical protein
MMTKRISSQSYRPQYDISRHHTWTGTVLLSVLLALRIFLEMAEIKYIPDTVFIILGAIIAFYTLGALFFTFRYRRALLRREQEAVQQSIKATLHTSKKSEKVPAKQQYKIEKKKQKAQVKKEKKTAK